MKKYGSIYWDYQSGLFYFFKSIPALVICPLPVIFFHDILSMITFILEVY